MPETMRVCHYLVQTMVPAAVGSFVMLALAGCLAQQADLVETRVDLDNKIKKLNDKERQIQNQVDLANELIKKQKEEVDQLVKETRARLRAEIGELRDEALPKMQGAQDEQSKQVRDLSKRLDDRAAKFEQALAKRDADSDKRLGSLKAEQEARLTSLEKAMEKAINEQAASLTAAQKADRDHLYAELLKLGTRLDESGKSVVEVTKRLEARLQEHDRALGAGDAKTGGLAQQLDQQGRTVTEQVAQFGKALADFKFVLTGLGDKTDALASQAEADAKTTTSHLNEVNRSVTSVAKAVETMGGTFAARIEQQEQRLGEVGQTLATMGSRVEQQDQRLADVAGSLQAVTSQVETLGKAATTPPHAPESGTKRGAKSNKRVGAVEPEQKSTQRAEVDPALQVSSDKDAGEQAPPVEPAPTAASAELPAPAVAAVPHPVEQPIAGAKQAYEASLAKFKRGDLQAAQRGFTEFLARFPTSELAPNAQYWLGECYYSKRDYRRAIEAFDLVKQVYPRSEKVPAALLKQSFAYLEVNERARAATLLKEIVDAYPKSPEAGKAETKLAQLEKKR